MAVNVSHGGFRVFMASSSSELSSCAAANMAVVVENKHLEVKKIWKKRDLQIFEKCI